jgi:penicillin-binding protein-related factor A (putative recombinase)
VQRLNCLAFVIVYFSLYDCFYLLPVYWIEQYQKKYQSKTIQYEIIKRECIKLEIIYPGILDLKEKIQMLINKS